MNTKCLVASVAGAVVLFVGGYVLYELVLGGFFAANAGSATGVIKESPDFLWIAVGQLASGGVLATALGWKGATDVAGGAQAGAKLGALIAVAFGFVMLGAMNISTLASVVVDVVVTGVLWGAAGAVVGMMLGRGD
ncbi:hypothetical protein [Candidatus Palauibacter polyketidifaciens]|uniref:hypothetical protein n=1 Tax=Candidatus Palauibacter TaxID=3056650 RepID=UPI00139E3FBF|nr:hypothetical protein [Candidatus Palauibacter polyketidifaciens]MDE2721177.1 hypothetical protein [Candidatus Palauibacter polyketidifaciens]MYE33997.1 hypothetical protein [Gemmatimonadales bacterium]